ncbi:collagen triple helix repeat protein [Aspergillus saccharolyticus JOP 1030-1]|uniref:CCHC-type domain-containing protein n=1 Tax=Aspergillus saccharolyticus JOP 1030-1 TaxID=1450539 RepID=A0A318Z574_9EURO|nr:hypothetical protein BP01DRAFT_386289 [Aspergillus saccharolyticus JOP 1030-1]PYH41604.1 hypothetical protein BP01DRAFT_386289 [Aspergillus saccharolyticus JOP 1030-1]
MTRKKKNRRTGTSSAAGPGKQRPGPRPGPIPSIEIGSTVSGRVRPLGRTVELPYRMAGEVSGWRGQSGSRAGQQHLASLDTFTRGGQLSQNWAPAAQIGQFGQGGQSGHLSQSIHNPAGQLGLIDHSAQSNQAAQAHTPHNRAAEHNANSTNPVRTTHHPAGNGHAYRAVMHPLSTATHNVWECQYVCSDPEQCVCCSAAPVRCAAEHDKVNPIPAYAIGSQPGRSPAYTNGSQPGHSLSYDPANPAEHSPANTTTTLNTTRPPAGRIVATHPQPLNEGPGPWPTQTDFQGSLHEVTAGSTTPDTTRDCVFCGGNGHSTAECPERWGNTGSRIPTICCPRRERTRRKRAVVKGIRKDLRRQRETQRQVEEERERLEKLLLEDKAPDCVVSQPAQEQPVDLEGVLQQIIMDMT